MNDKNLCSIEIQILEYIDENCSINKKIGFDLFGIPCFEEAITHLIEDSYVQDLRDRTRSDDKAQYLGLYCLTDKGRLYLANYKLNEKALHIQKIDSRKHDFALARYSALWGALSGFLSGLLSSYLIRLITK